MKNKIAWYHQHLCLLDNRLRIVNEKIVQKNCNNSASALYGVMHNHDNINALKKIYEQLLQEQKEKYEAQIEVLNIKLNSKK